MADFETPSFSLGLDFDLDSQPQQELISNLSLNGNAESAERSLAGATRRRIPDDDDFETLSTVLDPQVSEPPRSLKRLRRGPTSEPTLAANKVEPKVLWLDVDEIEEFSEEDQPVDDAMKHQYCMCSSSKLPLHGHGVFASQSAKQLKGCKKKEDENASASADTKAATDKLVFRKLTVSPLRKFQLIDSDSDETCLDEGSNDIVNQVDSPSSDRNCNLSQVTAATDLKKAKESVSLPQNEDLWKEICSEKNFHVPTPALDEVCEEYFRSVKNRDKFQKCLENCYETSNSDRSNGQQCSLGPLPSAHHYYFHEDPRIQELVRARLPNFFPLGSGSNQGNRQQTACTIDYMSQFNHGEASKPAKQKKDTMPSTSRRRKNVRNSKAQELSQGSESWVNPRSSAGIPKDAGKRRIHAVGKSAGHWYTACDGRRVYVGRNGQELTGQIAYREYRRESGAGCNRSKKKAASKKKTTAKKK